MGTKETVVAEEFWDQAPQLFDLANQLSSMLESAAAVTESINDRVRELADRIPLTPEPLSESDPYLRDAMLTAIIHALRAGEDRERAELRVAVERVRQALRDLVDEQPVWRSGPRHAVVWLRELGIPTSDLANLLGASESSVRRWSSRTQDGEPTGPDAERAIVIAKIVNHLRHAMTPRGAVQWLMRPHPALDHRPPVDELKDMSSYRHLIHLASGTRSFVAT